MGKKDECFFENLTLCPFFFLLEPFIQKKV